MRIAALVLCLLCAPAAADVTGRWLITYKRHDVISWWNLELVQKGTQLTGKFDTDPLTGTITDGKIAFVGKDPNNAGTDTIEATLEGDTIKGQLTVIFGDDSAHPLKAPFTAERIPPRAAKPQRRTFAPTKYFRDFGPRDPVMHVGLGDTIVTTTVDAGGNDMKGNEVSLGGNPQTGPFYVDGAMPGDTLVVKIVKLRLNRDYAISDDGIVPRALDAESAAKAKDLGKDVRWKLDRQKMIGTSSLPGKHLTTYTVPLKPMLGCIATATHPAGQAPPPVGDSGEFGGNMDFNEIVEGSTVYLPVVNPGALLYFGDGHAAQGDGETTGNALETSLDVEVQVDVIPGKHLPAPRVENGTHVMALGYRGSLDDALKAATANMAAWLEDTYGLSPSEIAQIYGTAAEYRVTEIADRNAGVALKLNKDRLRTIKR
ncbi:MAG: acetamidase/formamidase family protein [Kofleriaceae bacterium]